MILRLLRWLLKGLYGYRAFNAGVAAARGPVLLLPNHVSWWDWLLIGVCLEPDWRFVTSSTTAQISWLHRRIMVNRRTFPVDMNSPYAVKHMAEFLQRGGRLVLFPEGRISRTGSLMKLFDGTGFLIHRTEAKVITAYIRGAERLPFSPNPNRKRWLPRLSVHFSPLLSPPRLEHVNATDSRNILTHWLRDAMVRQKFETDLQFSPPTVLEAISQTARRWPGLVVLEDASLQSLTYRRLLLGAGLLAGQWRARMGGAPRRVGVLLPNVNAMPVVLLSLWAAGLIPAILNYTTGPATLLACARLAGLRQVITSRSFLARTGIDLAPLEKEGIEILFLEEVRKGIGPARKAAAAIRQRIAPGLAGGHAGADETAVILFTSGSEGEPKGVELTHRNLLSNIHQMLSVIDLMDTDRLFNALPLFHSFGLSVGLLLPLVRSGFTVLYLSPLHYRIVPSAFYNLNCTVFFGTNTFLNGYARKANPADFGAVRYIFAGAEKVHETTSLTWMRQFGVRILEGYGATECSPCISVNLPSHPLHGTAGRFLPGIEHRLEPVEGLAPGSNAGRLFVKGPNVMRGYLNPGPNARFQALGGWYDTGDIASVDSSGFVTILGRLKRFAKVSGEMVSLAAVEEALAAAFSHHGLRFTIAVLARPDESRGEKLVAVTNEPRLTLDEIRSAVRAAGLGNLAVPRELKVLHDIPRLGTGKVNLRALEQLIDAS